MNVKFPVKCKTGEVVYNYKEYLQTNHWKQTKLQYLKSHNSNKELNQRAKKIAKCFNSVSSGNCLLCNKETDQLEIHHLTYERLGEEKRGDLVAICRDCHDMQHKTYNHYGGRKSLYKIWEITKSNFSYQYFDEEEKLSKQFKKKLKKKNRKSRVIQQSEVKEAAQESTIKAYVAQAKSSGAFKGYSEQKIENIYRARFGLPPK